MNHQLKKKVIKIKAKNGNPVHYRINLKLKLGYIICNISY